jgi:GGDEF domain-containing protein
MRKLIYHFVPSGIGIASNDTNADDDLDHLLVRADAALYRAKNNGCAVSKRTTSFLLITPLLLPHNPV